MSELAPALVEKRDQLLAILRSYGRVAVAYSGGVDSAVVAKAAQLACEDKAVAVTAVSASLASGEREAAANLAVPAGLPIYALRAQGRHKSDSACTGWPTVRASERGPRNHETAKRKLNEDGRTIHHRIEDLLTALATSTGYPNPTFLLWLMGFPAFWIKFAPSVTPSTRRSRPSSSKQR